MPRQSRHSSSCGQGTKLMCSVRLDYLLEPCAYPCKHAADSQSVIFKLQARLCSLFDRDNFRLCMSLTKLPEGQPSICDMDWSVGTIVHNLSACLLVMLLPVLIVIQ